MSSTLVRLHLAGVRSIEYGWRLGLPFARVFHGSVVASVHRGPGALTRAVRASLKVSA